MFAGAIDARRAVPLCKPGPLRYFLARGHHRLRPSLPPTGCGLPSTIIGGVMSPAVAPPQPMLRTQTTGEASQKRVFNTKRPEECHGSVLDELLCMQQVLRNAVAMLEAELCTEAALVRFILHHPPPYRHSCLIEQCRNWSQLGLGSINYS